MSKKEKKVKEPKSQMKACKVCGKEIAKNAKVCPYCGAKNKKPLFKRWWFIAILVIIAVLIIYGIVSSMDSAATKEAKNMSKASFIKSCQTYDYKNLDRNAEKLTGKHIKVTLWVEQNVDDTMFRAYSKGKYDDNTTGWMENEYILNDVRDSQNPKMIEKDIVTVYGVYDGKQTVDRAIGGSDDIPAIDVIYIKINNK